MDWALNKVEGLICHKTKLNFWNLKKIELLTGSVGFFCLVFFSLPLSFQIWFRIDQRD